MISTETSTRTVANKHYGFGWSRISLLCCLLVFSGWFGTDVSGQQSGGGGGVTHAAGQVVDQTGAPVSGATLILRTTQGSVIGETVTNSEGSFTVSGLSIGSFVLTIAATNFQARQMSVAVTSADSVKLRIVLAPEQLRDEVTVTATRGSAVAVEEAAHVVSVRDQQSLGERPLPTIGNALEGSPGVTVQQTTYNQVSPFLRGLTGYHVINLIDGVRFNNSTFRSGPNQYLAFVEPGQVQRIEALLGPTSSQYGSDSLGGTIHLLTLEPRFGGGKKPEFHGDVQAFAASADASGGLSLRLSLGTERMAWLIGGTHRRHNDLRAGGGADSHHVFRRFFGLSANQIRDVYGDRHQDTGFSQTSWHTKLAARLANNQSLQFWYQQSDLGGGRGYKDLWGGLGRLRSDFDPQGLRFFYARYEKLRLGVLDSLSGTFSVNSQLDGTLRQGLRSTDTIIRDNTRVDSFGYSAQGTTHLGDRQAVVFGGEVYDEHVRSDRFEQNPRTGIDTQRRALYPNGSRYTTYGLFAQDTVEVVRGKLRAGFGGRITRVGFSTEASSNLDASGLNLGVTDARQSYQDATFNTSLAWQATEFLNLNVLVGRGFRAPNLNDLGALGLNDLGFEVPAEEAARFGALVGSSDGEDAISTARQVGKLMAERLYNYELGATFRARRFYGRTHVFDAELKDPIVRRTLLFPADRSPDSLFGIPVTAIAPTATQRAQGATSVRTGLDPRAVKAFINEGQARYYGVEALFRQVISPKVSTEGNYTYLIGRELNPNRFVRRLPPQQGFLAVRYQPDGRRPWVQVSGNFVGRQERLSGGDTTDERIGAARRRRDITDFFQGSLVRPYIEVGPDNLAGTGDDLFTPTNETLAEIRDRVLPLGATVGGVRITDDNSRAPLYLATPGFVSLNLHGGVQLAEKIQVNAAVMNLLDRNYRVHGSGVDAPGINLFIGLKVSF